MRRMHIAILIVAAWGALSMPGVTPALADNTVTVYATAQRFENGLMIWRSDTGHIWALADDGRVWNFPAEFYSDLPDNPITGTPPSRLRPILGFGKVWGHHAEVREVLGWPVLPELGFAMPIRTVGGTVYLTQLDNSVIQINADGTWRYTDAATPAIVAFSASPDPVAPGGTLTVTWDVRGTELAILELYDANNPSIPFTLLQDLPIRGSAPITVPVRPTEAVRVVLWGANRPPRPMPVTMYEHVVQASLTVAVRSDLIQTIQTRAAYQRYERGFMIWRADTGAVMVFWGDGGGQWTTFPEEHYRPLPDNPFTETPAGRVRPISGFGRVWGNSAYLREMLGWATEPEQGYDMIIHFVPGANPQSFSLPDGQTVSINRNFWRR